MRPDDFPRDCAERVNRLARKGYNHDGEGGLSLRPDVHRLILDACNGRPRLLAPPIPCSYVMEMAPAGTVCLCFFRSIARGKLLNLTFADGSTILHERGFADGSTLSGVIHHAMGAEADTAEALAEHFRWLARED